MNSMMFILPALVVALIAIPLISVARGVKTGKQARNRVIGNLCMFFGVCLCAFIFPLSAFAAEANGVVNAIIGTSAQGMGFLAAALVTGLAAIGAGIAVAAAAPAAIGAVSEDPKSFGKAIIFVVLGEGIAIYGLLISILIINKL
ncbi:V/A-type H+-transporting ATPase subunit K [Hydrogenoanaerobacterium saccharovorans]|uniref:ATP synthase F(0) sector subunit c n=1 Tax=Hydrogenoanaerobacterium saccharovorans TaxID=474960 RepID=A0A1H8AFM1_9FIRM|nr:ATP synthase subunit C [Hydrogenoanaerobacterium saccharovorans]RPF47971.1 V/A-type H+-transporting ATPase subunit K [Hydrogenoanaerobacterium saccharovorans]SEM69530.1 V/A-type H+-transporting ATPase subunit K [Hydrogenoanaerobacterium saccharovorans]